MTTSERPDVLLAALDWRLHGACCDEEPELFFHQQGERALHRTNRERTAKAVCARCPVLRQCRAHALSTREAHGVWGGLTQAEREDVRAAQQPDVQRELSPAAGS